MSLKEPEYIALKLYGEAVATVIVMPSWDRRLVVERHFWTRDEALILADWIKEHLEKPVALVDRTV